jgi:hypothetical protein
LTLCYADSIIARATGFGNWNYGKNWKKYESRQGTAGYAQQSRDGGIAMRQKKLF